MKRFIYSLIIIFILLFLYGYFIETYNLVEKEYTLPINNLPETFKDLKIVQFSDILYNNNYDNSLLEKVVDKINEENADIVIFSGDLFSNEKLNKESITYLKGLLTSINSNLYKFAVYGDNDLKYKDSYEEILKDSEFELLDNKSKLLFYKENEPINIMGLTNLDNIDEALIPELDIVTDYNIVITHKPDLFKELKNKDINVVLSGHSLGGIINIPYYGGLIKKDGANSYINGKYELDNKLLFINNGIGYEKYKFRLFNSPSINVYHFE